MKDAVVQMKGASIYYNSMAILFGILCTKHGKTTCNRIEIIS